MRRTVLLAALAALAASGCKAPSDRIHSADGSVAVGRLETIGGGAAVISGLTVQVPSAPARVWGRNGASLVGVVTLQDGTVEVQTGGGSVEMPLKSVAAIIWGETGVTSGVFEVPARAGWTGTGIEVKRGDFITVSAGGTVSTEAGASGPDGVVEFSATTSLAPQAVGGALIMRIGSDGEVVQAGSRWTGNAPSDGEIQLAVNAHLPGSTVSDGGYTAAVTAGPGLESGMTAVFPAGRTRFSL